jgi:hypothetical protein
MAQAGEPAIFETESVNSRVESDDMMPDDRTII